MCVIIYKPKGVAADKELLKTRHTANSDSWGFSCVGPTWKHDPVMTGFGGFDEFWEAFSARQGHEAVIHFRTGTSGIKKGQGAQPIVVNNVAVFHNGNFPEYFGRGETDTVLWCKDNPDPIGHLKEIERYCRGNNSRMAFVDLLSGKAYLVNEQSGVWEEGCWFSNARLGNYAGFGYSGINLNPKEERYL